jgi:hypothetical protein
MHKMAARNGSAFMNSSVSNTYEGRLCVQHSKRIDSFCVEDEHFFGSYEAEPASAEGSLTLEFDTLAARAPTAEQLAHFTRFRKPVACIIAAMGSLSLVALGQSLQQNSRREVVAHIGSATALPAAERSSQAPWSSTEFAESAIFLGLEPTRPSTSGSRLSSLDEAATQASLVNDFTSALLAMCRDVPT